MQKLKPRGAPGGRRRKISPTWKRKGYRDLAKLGAHFDVKFAEQLLDNAREELVQLEKMYKADDLTEETEEIILRRQRNAVESAEFRLGRVKVEAEQQLTVGIPRQGEALKAARRDAELAHELAEKNLPRALEQKRFEVDKLRRDNAKAEEKLADLRADRKLAVVKSPAEGILIYGTSEEGAFPGAAGAAKKLVPGGKVAAREIIMTVVDPGKLAAFAKIPEAKLADVAPGREGVAAPEANPAAEIPAKVESLGYIPAVGGGYPAKLSLQPPADLMPPLMPGMKLKVSLGTSEKENVLLAPKSAIFEEDGKSFAYLAKEDGGHEKREVKVGATNGKNLEVKDGLKEGDKILAKKPE
ncbi:MAG: HlyD family efflux transporter periplasmic adaptor subunit [Verrucomicrobiales bacterium]